MLDPITFYHKYVEEGAFAPSCILSDNKLYLHDNLEGIIATFEKQEYASLALKKYGGTLFKTPKGTYRLVKEIT
jgi:hypothetical protein